MKSLVILVAFISPAFASVDTGMYSLTLDKDSGGINTAFYGGMVKNKLLYSSIQNDGSSETLRKCWFGTAPGVSGVLVKEQVKRYRKFLNKKKESRVEQAVYVDRNMATVIQDLLKLYKSDSSRFRVALDSDKRTITLDVLAQGQDKKLAKLAQTAIKRVNKVCDI